MLLILGHSIIAAIYNPRTCFLLIPGLSSGPSIPITPNPAMLPFIRKYLDMRLYLFRSKYELDAKKATL
jgi:hypothetical protein